MPVRIENQDGIITAFIMGDIDHHSAKEIRETIDFGKFFAGNSGFRF